MPAGPIVLSSRTRISSSLLLSVLVGALAVPGVVVAQRPAAAAPAIDHSWLTFDASTRSVTFALTAGLTPFNGGLNFNGFRDGELTLVVPAGWSVVVNVENHDGMLPHSAEVVPDDGSTPLGPVAPAIPHAATRDLAAGLPAGGGKDVMRFAARPAGNYRLYCAVPGHGAAGMWIRLKVDAGVRAPSLVLSPKPAR